MSIEDLDHYLSVRECEKQIDTLNMPPMDKYRAYFGILFEFFKLEDYDNMLQVAAKINFDIYDPETDPEIAHLRPYIKDFPIFILTVRQAVAQQQGL